MSQDAGAEGSAVKVFFRGVWLNRRFTGLLPSILLGVPFSALMLWTGWLTARNRLGDLLFTAAYALGCVVLYPVAREGYYRVTQPLRDGLGEIWLGGPLVLVAYLVRLLIYLLLVGFAVPVGLVSGIYLGLAEVSGHGWRYGPSDPG